MENDVVQVCNKALAFGSVKLIPAHPWCSLSLEACAKQKEAVVTDATMTVKETPISRRDAVTLFGVAFSVPSVVHASGGATAGGAYL